MVAILPIKTGYLGINIRVISELNALTFQLHFMTVAAIGCYVAGIVFQQILGVSRVRIMATGAGKFPVGLEWILGSSYRMSFTIKPGNNMGT